MLWAVSLSTSQISVQMYSSDNHPLTSPQTRTGPLPTHFLGHRLFLYSKTSIVMET